jgi:hypothetical protein
MITDKQTIKQLQFRSDLPRFKDLFIFAQLESVEQKLGDEERFKLIINAYADLIKDESSAMLFDNKIISVLPKAYKIYADSDPDYNWLECIYEIEGDRNKYVHGKIKIFKKAFAYFVMDDLRSVAEVSISSDWAEV